MPSEYQKARGRATILQLYEPLLIMKVQKAKLKVGKARPKAENFTDTSFRSKGMPFPPSQYMRTPNTHTLSKGSF